MNETSQYKALFLSETDEHLLNIERGLLFIEDEDNYTPAKLAETIDDLFRHYHSIKGMCASMGYENLKDFSHAQEALLSTLRDSKQTPGKGIISTLLASLDLMKRMNENIRLDNIHLETPEGSEIKETAAALKEELASLSAINKKKSQSSDGLNDKPESMQTQSNKPLSQKPLIQKPVRMQLPTTMKVESSVFDNLLRITGELFINHSKLSLASRALGSRAKGEGVQASRAQGSSSALSLEQRESLHKMSLNIEELHEEILNARMLPINNLTQNLPRIVRDIAASSGKDVEILFEGTALKLDRAVLESMGDPLIHLVRNAVDHGIEEPRKRQASGKPTKGLITVRAREEGEFIALDVHDDGKGIDAGKLRAKAAMSGLTEAQVSAMTDDEALMLVCTPGLSLKETITDISGRGVGMDVVKSAIEAVGGTLKIASSRGEFTRTTMTMPKSASIMKLLLIGMGPEVMGLPMSKVERVVELRGDELKNGEFNFGRNTIRAINLSKLLGIDGAWSIDPKPDEIMSAAIVRADKDSDSLRAIIVDQIIDEVDALIRPLMPPFTNMFCTSGLTITGDGRAVFLLDVAETILAAKDMN
jgi:two-component system chemotaxis sensor kinase CheA